MKAKPSRQTSAKCAPPRESRIRMDRLGVGHLGGGDDPVDAEEASSTALSNAHGLVGMAQPGAVGIGGRVDRPIRHRAPRGPDDAERDFTTIRDEDPRKMRLRPLSGVVCRSDRADQEEWLAELDGVAVDEDLLDRAVGPALISLKIFIASTR